MSESARLCAQIYGEVQGVSFRYYTLREAQSLGLTGYVRNEEDGSVRVVAEGEREKLDKLLIWLRRGPPSAGVSRLEHHWGSPRGNYGSFEVRI